MRGFVVHFKLRERTRPVLYLNWLNLVFRDVALMFLGLIKASLIMAHFSLNDKKFFLERQTKYAIGGEKIES
jgi:hypothetical protein